MNCISCIKHVFLCKFACGKIKVVPFNFHATQC